MSFQPIVTSKHQTLPGDGKVRLNHDSGIKKLARAIRRGKVPPERQFTINMAEERGTFKRMLRGMEKNPT